MQGATDGGYHIEKLRTGNMPAGRCPLCKKWFPRLGRHHERYMPERFLRIDMDGKGNCHWKVHFQPWALTNEQKEILLECRHGRAQWNRMARHPKLRKKLLDNYIAPGRRDAQLLVRREMKRRAKEKV